MKKAKNILLLVGICLYIINAALGFLYTLPNISHNNEVISSYTITSALFCVFGILLFIALPAILLCLNLKNKYKKVFSIIVATLSALASVYILIGPYILAVPQYLILSKIGLIDTWWGVFLLKLLPSSGLFSSISLISSITITVGAIFSLKKDTKEA